MAEEEAAWHALTLIQLRREGKETSDNSDCPAHAYAEGLGTRVEGNLFKSHSVPLFMKITQSQSQETRLQGVSGSLVYCRQSLSHSSFNVKFHSELFLPLLDPSVNHSTSKSTTHPSCFLINETLKLRRARHTYIL